MDANERVFYDRLFQVLRGFMEYGRYKGNQENAMKVLFKAFPQRSISEVSELFIACCNAYTEAMAMVKENLSYYSKSTDPVIPTAEKDFRKKYEAINEKMLTWIIGWIYHWHHER